MKKNYPEELIEDIYNEADKDIIFFSYASSFVNNDEDYLIDENEIVIFENTLKFISFLSETGDFELGKMKKIEGDIKFIPYENAMADFELDARLYMKNEGLHCDALSWELAIRKI
jgi:hypothetical protein